MVPMKLPCNFKNINSSLTFHHAPSIMPESYVSTVLSARIAILRYDAFWNMLGFKSSSHASIACPPDSRSCPSPEVCT